MPRGSDFHERTGFRRSWRDNHGNLLLALAGAILLVGSLILLTGQKQSRPPRPPVQYQSSPPSEDDSDPSENGAMPDVVGEDSAELEPPPVQ